MNSTAKGDENATGYHESWLRPQNWTWRIRRLEGVTASTLDGFVFQAHYLFLLLFFYSLVFQFTVLFSQYFSVHCCVLLNAEYLFRRSIIVNPYFFCGDSYYSTAGYLKKKKKQNVNATGTRNVIIYSLSIQSTRRQRVLHDAVCVKRKICDFVKTSRETQRGGKRRGVVPQSGEKPREQCPIRNVHGALGSAHFEVS